MNTVKSQMTGSGTKSVKNRSAQIGKTVDAGPAHLCYVDDSRTSAYVVKRLLRPYGYSVDHFTSAEPALVALVDNQYDLLLTDLKVSPDGMDGDDLVRALRSSGHHHVSSLPVIVITGATDDAVLNDVYAAGANQIMSKPVNGDELDEHIRNLVESYKQGLEELSVEIPVEESEPTDSKKKTEATVVPFGHDSKPVDSSEEKISDASANTSSRRNLKSDATAVPQPSKVVKPASPVKPTIQTKAEKQTEENTPAKAVVQKKTAARRSPSSEQLAARQRLLKAKALAKKKRMAELAAAKRKAQIEKLRKEKAAEVKSTPANEPLTLEPMDKGSFHVYAPTLDQQVTPETLALRSTPVDQPIEYNTGRPQTNTAKTQTRSEQSAVAQAEAEQSKQQANAPLDKPYPQHAGTAQQTPQANAAQTTPHASAAQTTPQASAAQATPQASAAQPAQEAQANMGAGEQATFQNQNTAAGAAAHAQPNQAQPNQAQPNQAQPNQNSGFQADGFTQNGQSQAANGQQGFGQSGGFQPDVEAASNILQEMERYPLVEADFSNTYTPSRFVSTVGSVLELYGTRKLITLGVVAIALAILYSIWSDQFDEGRPLSGVTVEQGEIFRSISVPGKVVSKLRTNVTPSIAGRLTQIKVEEGDRVKSGDLLALLDDREAKSYLKRAKANHESAKEDVLLAERALKRLSQAFSKGAVAKQLVEEAEVELRSAKARESIASEEVRTARLSLENPRIVAPFAGTITSRFVEVGQWVVPSETLFTLIDERQKEIEVQVESADSSGIAVGQTVGLSSEAFPGLQWSESVTRLAAAASNNGRANTVSVYISLGNNAPSLRFGQQVDAEIRTAWNPNAIKLPFGAILTKGGRSYVAVYENGRVHYAEVVTGIEDFTHVEIQQGVSIGQTVLITRGDEIKEGERIKLLR